MRHPLFNWVRMACASCLLSFFAAEKPPPAAPTLKLTGRVEGCEVTEDGSHVRLSLRLRLDFTNTGDAPVLVLWDELLLVARHIGDRPPGDAQERRLYFGSSSPSIERSEEWAKRRREVDRESPPEEVRRLAPGETLTLEKDDWFTLGRARSHSAGNASWEEIKAAGRPSLRVTFQTWPLNIEPRANPSDDKKLGGQLRERWKASGLLALDGVTSEPIEFSPQTCKPKEKADEGR
jgi:hypothetical protein